MNRHWITGCLLALAGAAAGAQALDDAAIRKELANLVEVNKQAVGIVVGIVDRNGSRILARGVIDQDDPRSVDGDSVFEIGSITKVFTSLLLADMVRRGEVALDDPVAKYLPEGVSAPERGGKQITLVDLATHTSGLPRLPGNLMPADADNPYADYTAEHMYAFLSRHELRRDIGAQFEYSNYGAGLLGHVLARKAGMDYEALLKQRVLDPLQMTSSAITFTPQMKLRLAVGHRGDLSDAPNWDLYTLAGAGGIRSTANDLLKFASANLGLTRSPLDEAMKDMRKVRRAAGGPGAQIALGWIVPKNGAGEIFTHNGGTGGYRSFLAIDLEQQTGIVVLVNTANTVADRLGERLAGLGTATEPQRPSVTLDTKVYDSYAGRYQIGPRFFIDITRDGDTVFAQATGQERFEIRPETATKFFSVDHPVQISFIAENGKPAGELIIHQAGMNTPGKRVEPNAPSAFPERRQITLPPDILDRHVGTYELLPNFLLVVTREGNALFAQLTAQPKARIFAEGENRFFYGNVDAQVTFHADTAGKTSGLTLHQGGRDMPAKRIE